MNSSRTFFVTAPSFGRANIFQTTRMQRLFIEVLRHYRRQGKFYLHAFVMMPDHVHLLITPAENLSLEKCMQLIKGGFSYRATQEFGKRGRLWAAGFSETHVTNATQFANYADYIHRNPVKRGLVPSPELYECSSAWPGRRMDPSAFARAKAQSN
jgi:putative transposase